MPQQEIKGGAETLYLSGSLTNVATSFASKATPTSAWPTGVNPFVVTVDRGTASEEKMLVGARSGTGFSSVTRAYDGTTATTHSDNATVEHTANAVMLQEANSHVNDVTRDDHTQYTKKSILSAKGGAFFASAASTPAYQAPGANDTVIVYDSAQTNGVKGIQLTNAQISASAAIALSKLATIANATLLGNNSGSSGVPLALTVAQVKTLLALASTDLSDFTEAVQDIVGALVGFGGSGLTFTYDDAGNAVTLAVNVDGSTIEINSDTLRIKDAGVTGPKLAAALPRGLLAAPVSVTADQGSISSTYVDLLSLTRTVTPETATRYVEVEGFAHFTSGTAGDEVILAIREGSTVLHSVSVTHVQGNVYTPVRIRWPVVDATLAAHTYKLSAKLGSGTGPFTMHAAAGVEAWMTVMDVGGH